MFFKIFMVFLFSVARIQTIDFSAFLGFFFSYDARFSVHLFVVPNPKWDDRQPLAILNLFPFQKYMEYIPRHLCIPHYRHYLCYLHLRLLYRLHRYGKFLLLLYLVINIYWFHYTLNTSIMNCHLFLLFIPRKLVLQKKIVFIEWSLSYSRHCYFWCNLIFFEHS